MALGAFIAGMLISETEFRHEVEEDIKPFRDVLMGLFFVSVGMMLNVDFFGQHFFSIIGLTALFIVVKSLLTLPAVLVQGYPLRAAIITSLSLAQVGEFGFVLAASGLAAGLFDMEAYQNFLDVSVLTMMLTPGLMLIAPRLADKLAGQQSASAQAAEADDGKSHLKDHLIIVGFGISGKHLAHVAKESGIEYTILEQPKAPSPTQEKPIRENPVQANPMLDAPIQENPAKLNKEESSNYPSKTDLSITQESSPILSSPPVPSERSGQDGMRKRESYRALILENIEYDVLSQNVQLDKDRLDELVELMVDTVCSNREMIRVAGDDYPAEVVRSRFLKLNASHIEYVLDRMRENTTYVRNIKKYLLATLFNAPSTMGSYYSALVQHDFYGDGLRGK